MKTLIIAEAGINHNGDVKLAEEMIEVAKWAGADIVKFQTFSGFPSLKNYELSKESHIRLMKRCGEVGIEFLSTAFDLESIDLLHSLGLTRWKIPSGQITDLPYLRKIASFKERVILSTGASTMAEIESALDVLGKSDITLLHCTSQYPCPIEDTNLYAMERMRSYFNVDIGYSDHTLGIEIPVVAVALGATIIEKHFTLLTGVGPDYQTSLLPGALADMCNSIRRIESAIGTEKAPTDTELEGRRQFRKSIVASRKILMGEVLCEENLTTARPGTGVSPMQWDDIVGFVAMRSYERGEQI